MSKQRRTFSAEATALVLDQGYSHMDAYRSLTDDLGVKLRPRRS